MPPDAPAAEQPAGNGADFGLTAEEQAAYESMRSEPPPSGDPGHTPEASSEPAPAAPAVEPAAAEAKPTTAPSGTAASAPAPEADEEDEIDPAAPVQADGTKLPKRVSYNKYRRVEDEAKKTKADLDTARAQNAKSAETQARLDERLRLINEALKPAEAAQVDEDPEPDPEKDIFGHNAWLKRQLVKERETTNDRFNRIESERQAATADNEIASTYVADAQHLAATEPNFLPAYQYLMSVRIQQLANYHFGKDLTDPAAAPLTGPELAKIKSEVGREERQLVSQAIKSGKSPAAAVYAMARMTGFRPAAPGAAPVAATAPAAGNGAGTGSAPAVAAAVAAATPAAGNGAAPAAKPSVRQEIAAIKAGQEAALSLSAGGGAPAPILNAEKLANMPEEEFGALLDKMSRGELQRVMEGR